MAKKQLGVHYEQNSTSTAYPTLSRYCTHCSCKRHRPSTTRLSAWSISPTRLTRNDLLADRTRNFELRRLAYGDTPAGYFYSANTFCTPEHGGTHIDAPIHFAQGKLTLEALPLEELIGPAVVIDIARNSVQAIATIDSPSRHSRFRAKHGRSSRQGASSSCGRDGAVSGLTASITSATSGAVRPRGSVSRATARRRHGCWSKNARVAVLGVDTASIDYGRSQDFIVHRIAAAKNVPGLENLTGLEALPPRGATLIALPMKIEGGSGGPAPCAYC